MKSIRPNILVVICDDLGVGDLGCYGNPLTRTPRLDAFRSGGVTAERHISGPLCSPARACLLTGSYNYRHRVTDTYCGRSLMDPDVRTLADRLAEAGYRTGCFGKWHLGDNCPFRPQDRGFHETVVHGSGGIGQPGDDPANQRRESYFDPVLSVNGTPQPFSGHCTGIFAEAAIRFLSASDERPWFAYLAFNAPHTPLQIAEERIEACRERGATGDCAALYALVEDIDTQFGRVLDAIASTGQSENTVIYFTSDHGPCPSVNAGSEGQRFNAGLRGQKGHVYEGGARVPSFWHWPSRWEGGRMIAETTHAIDVAPTLLEAARVSVPSGEMDGISLGRVLDGQPADARLRERPLFLQWHRGDRPVLHRNAAVWQGGYKWLRVCEAGPDELYDLKTDPGETQDLAASDPERCQRLREAYEQWFSEVGRPHDYAPLRIRLGDPREPVLRLSRQDWRVIGPDGWSSSHQGFWPIEVVHPGPWTVTATFEHPPSDRGSVVLEIDGQLHVLEAVPGCRGYAFEALAFATGPVNLSAHLTTRFTFQSVESLSLSRH